MMKNEGNAKSILENAFELGIKIYFGADKHSPNNLKIKRELFEMSPFVSRSLQSAFVTGDIRAIVKEELTALNVMNYIHSKDLLSAWTLKTVGNMAFIFLHSPYESIREAANIRLLAFEKFSKEVGAERLKKVFLN